MSEPRIISPVTFFDGTNDPNGMTDFAPRYGDPALFEMPEPTPEDLAKIEALAASGLTDDPEAGIVTVVPDIPAVVQLELPLGEEPEPRRSGKVPPA